MPQPTNDISPVVARPRRRRLLRPLSISLALSLLVSLFLGLTISTPSQAAEPVGLFSNSLRAQERVATTRSMNVGVRFTSAQDGTITALQYYRSSKQKKAYTATLWSASGAVLARVTLPAASRYGWYSVSLSRPVAIRRGTTYVASYLASDGQFGVIRDAFTQPYVRNGLTVPRNGGVYNYGTSSRMPTSSHRATNYLVDVVFTPTDGATPTSPPTAPVSAGSTNPLWTHRTVPNATVRAALGKRVFFGHQSIGAQALKGVSEYASDAGLGSQNYPDPETGSLPASGGFIAQSYVGQNGEPLAKLAEFDQILRSGVGNRIDVAVFKFCYADIRTGTQDPVAVFEAYQRTLSALERDFPNVTFLYATQPVVMANNSDGPNNIPRGVFNNLVRARYGSTGRLWDVAAIESSTLDGHRVTGTHQGTSFAALNPEFASPDQRHITGPGLKAVAGPLLELIAAA